MPVDRWTHAAGRIPEPAALQNNMTIALSRLAAQDRALDVSAANLANAATPGFQAERMVFADWLVRQPAGSHPPGGQTISYAQDRATYRDARPGPMAHTGNPLDLAIGDSDGMFAVQTPGGVRYTRAGHFEVAQDGRVVDGSGNALLDTQNRPIRLAPTDTNVSVTADGTLSTDNGRVAKIGIFKVEKPQSMRPEGARLFRAEAPLSPMPQPKVTQGAVEESNVQPIIEITRMMGDLRNYQFLGQFVQTEADRQMTAVQKIIQKYQ